MVVGLPRRATFAPKGGLKPGSQYFGRASEAELCGRAAFRQSCKQQDVLSTVDTGSIPLR